MVLASRYVAFVIFWWSLVLITSFAIANDEIQFDVPVLVEARKVPSPLDGLNEQLIEIVVPVSTVVNDNKIKLDGFNFDVHWNRNVYPLVDYSPRTQMHTNVDGTISVEQNREQSTNFGLNSAITAETFGTVGGNLGSNWKDGQTLRFQRIPKQMLLVSSGTIHRGTGAFFRFYPSDQLTLEGGRELAVTFRVPSTWRGGVLRVVCSASGSRTTFGGFGEPVNATKTFVVPTCLKSDEEARQVAIQYIQNEIELRRDWASYRERLEAARPKDLLSKIETALSGTPKNDFVPSSWATELIESGTDTVLVRHQRGLPAEIRNSAIEFSNSRSELYSLSR